MKRILGSFLVVVMMGLFASSSALSTPPILTVPGPPAQESGDWKYQQYTDFTEALTGNESGSTFGFLCGSKCSFYVDLQTSCDEGHTYPAMINSSAGSAQIALKCFVLDKRFVMLFDDDILASIKSGGQIGFAIPLKDGRFSVSRFSLNGAAAAVGWAANRASDMQKSSQTGLKDLTL